MKDVQNSNLSKTPDNTLLDEVKLLVRSEKEIALQVIEHLNEIELRKLHLARGFSSLFAFATEFLGYSEAEAHIRIQAARLTQAVPEVTSMIEKGEISLSVAAAAQSQFRQENLRRREEGRAPLSSMDKREALEFVSGKSRRKADETLQTHFAQPSTRTMHFEARSEFSAKIERLMDFMAHKNFDRNLGKMVELLVDQELAKYEISHTPKATDRAPEKGKAKDNKPTPPRQPPQETLSPSASLLSIESRSRYIPRKIRSLVWAKYDGKCTFKDSSTGRICNSRHAIQVDHRHAFAAGGVNQPHNLTLLCASHNQWKSNS